MYLFFKTNVCGQEESSASDSLDLHGPQQEALDTATGTSQSDSYLGACCCSFRLMYPSNSPGQKRKENSGDETAPESDAENLAA